MRKIAFMGAGAVGSYLAAYMVRSGEDVLLLDSWTTQIEKLKADGICVSDSKGTFSVPVTAFHLYQAQEIAAAFDIIFVTVKSYDTRWATTFIEPYLKTTGVAVSSQNSINDETIASIVGHSRTIGCVMSNIQVALWEPGHVIRGGLPGRDRGHDVFRIGELNGSITSRVEEIAGLLAKIDSSRTTTNLWGERWSKLTTNCMFNATGGISGLGLDGMASNPQVRLLQMHLAQEAIQVGVALNYRIEPVGGQPAGDWLQIEERTVFEKLDSLLRSPSPETQLVSDWQTSMGQDVIKGRRSEIDHLNGLVVRKGQHKAVPTPVNSAIVAVMHQVDSGEIQAHPSNIERVLHLANIL